jgi:hypothetical protein
VKAAEFQQMQAKAMSEADLTSHVVATAKRLRILRYHTVRTDPRSEAGFLDEVLVGRRGVLFRELKMQGKYPSPAQRVWLAKLAAAGEDAEVWRPVDWFSGRILAEMQAIA